MSAVRPQVLVIDDEPQIHRFLAPALERDLLLRFFPEGDWRRPPLWPGFGRYRSLAICFELLGVLVVGTLAFWLSTITDAPLAAVGGAVMVTIVAAILGQIDNLGVLRNALPLHYGDAWFDLLRPTVAWADLRHGLLWSLLWSGVFLSLGYALFRRKDVLS